MAQFDALLSPFKLKHLTLRNRVMSTAHEPSYTRQARLTERYIRYHVEKAKGGIGLTMFGGSCCVSPDSPASFGQLACMDDSAIEDFRTLAARVHVTAAGSLVAALLLLLTIYLLGITSWLLRLLLVAVLCVALYGAWLVARRRRNTPPARLSQAGFQRLPLSLYAFAGGFLPVSLATLAGKWHIGGVQGSSCSCSWVGDLVSWRPPPGRALKHAFAGALNLAFHPRQERFLGDKRSTDLRPLDLDAPKLGVELPIDFQWNRLLGFDACVQCGRCEMACPAFAAGQPLNPKKLIQDLVIGLSGPGSDRDHAGSPHPGQTLGAQRGAPDSAIVPDLIAA